MSTFSVSVFTESCKGLPTEQTFALLRDLGVTHVELGAGGSTDTTHLHPAALLRPGATMGQFRELLAAHNLTVSALVCNTNPVHPDKTIAAAEHQTFVDTCRLAAALNTDTVVVTSGCAGDCASSKHPNFIASPWNDEQEQVLSWQWERVLIPYWKSAAAIAASYGIRRLAFDMTVGNMVYNPRTLLRLRDEAGSTVGAAIDPAHLMAQGIVPAAAVRTLAGAVFHVRASDLLVDPARRAVNGVLDTHPDAAPFYHRAIGGGHDEAYWQEFVRALSDVGYDRCLSVRYDDDRIPAEEGLPLAVKAVQKLI